MRFGGILAYAGYGRSVPAGTYLARPDLGSGHPLQAEGLSGRRCDDLPRRWPRTITQELCVRCFLASCPGNARKRQVANRELAAWDKGQPLGTL